MNRRQFVVAAAALPLALRREPFAAAARLGGTPVALVTADTESRVIAVHLLDGAVRRVIRTQPGPRSIETVGNDAVVAHTAAGAVSVIDGDRLRVRHVIGGLGQPRYTAGSPDFGLAYVSDSARGEVAVLDLAAGRIVGRTAVDGPARHITIAPSGRSLWVALGSSAERIAVLSLERPHRPTLVRAFAPPFLAHDVAFEPGGRRVWVTSGDDRAPGIALCAPTGRLVGRLPGAATPEHVTFLAGRAFVSSGDDGIVRAFSLRTGHLERTTTTPPGSYNVQQGWGVVLTPSLTHGTLCVVDRRGRRLLDRRLAASSHDACFVMTAA